MLDNARLLALFLLLPILFFNRLADSLGAVLMPVDSLQVVHLLDEILICSDFDFLVFHTHIIRYLWEHIKENLFAWCLLLAKKTAPEGAVQDYWFKLCRASARCAFTSALIDSALASNSANSGVG